MTDHPSRIEQSEPITDTTSKPTPPLYNGCSMDTLIASAVESIQKQMPDEDPVEIERIVKANFRKIFIEEMSSRTTPQRRKGQCLYAFTRPRK